MSKGRDWKIQDAIKIDIVDIKLRRIPHETLIRSFLSKVLSLFWAWVTQKIQENAEELKLIGG